MSDLKPVAVFPRPKPGGHIVYERHRVTVTADGGLEIDGKAHQDTCVQFSRSFGAGASANCIVWLRHDRLEVYEGATMGMSMLTRDMVLHQCGC